MSKRDKTEFKGASFRQKALNESKLTLNDLSFVETHDCFTIAELIEYEAMGLTKRGEGFRALEEGLYTKMESSINPSGG